MSLRPNEMASPAGFGPRVVVFGDTLHRLKVVASGGPVVPGPPFEICAPHFTFAPPVAAYIQYCILKMWPPCC